MGAYPLTISLNTTESIIEIVSGQAVEDILVYIAHDFFGQVATNLGNRLAGIETDSEDIIIEEQSRASSTNWIFSFASTIIVGLSGTSGVFTFLSSSIDLDNYKAVFGTELSTTYIINTPFDIRFWVRGEAQENYIWVECETTTYTLKPNSTTCLPCPGHATCPGRDVIIVEEGYWRASQDTDIIYPCLNQNGCLGGEKSVCAAGYQGRLCNECTFTSDYKYSRSREYDWSLDQQLLIKFYTA